MDPRIEYRVRECLNLQRRIEQELSGLREEAEPDLKRQLAEIGELAHERELNFPYDEERRIVLHISTLARLVKIAWFGDVLINELEDELQPLAGITYTGSLNETWGHFIIRQEIMLENRKWLATGAYLVPAGAFAAAVFPAWKTQTLRRILIPECPLLPIVSYNEFSERLWQEVLSQKQIPSYR